MYKVLNFKQSILQKKIKKYQFKFTLYFVILFISKCIKKNNSYIKIKNKVLIHIRYLIFSFFLVNRIKNYHKKKLNYLYNKLWFLSVTPQNKLLTKKLNFFYKTFFLKLYSKVQNLNFFFIYYIQKCIPKKIKLIPLYIKNTKQFIFIKQAFINKVTLEKKQVFLNISFAKKNTFFNVSSPQGKTIYLTSVMREGYIGKKRVSYISIFSVASIINKLISNFFINNYCDIFIIYKGWSRFRSAIQEAFNKKKFSNLNIKYVKYIVKIPHNGCRSPKKRNRSRMQKYFVKKLL